MTEKEIIELMAEHAHDAWLHAYKSMGYESRKAEWGEEFMVPFHELSSVGQEFDRIIMRGILEAFKANGIALVESNSFYLNLCRVIHD